MDLRAEAKSLAPELPALPHLRRVALETWRGRMVNEHASSAVFEGLARQLARAGLDAATVAACLEFAAEERRHGVLCGAVVEALGGEARCDDRLDPTFPGHEDAPAAEAALRNLLSISCLSETVAVALIGAERLEMPEGALRALLTRIYADEIGHARFGWALAPRLVATLDAAGRERTAAYLAVALAALERHELAHLNPHAAPPPEGAAYGLCNGRDARALFRATVAEVIVPGLERLGLPGRAAWAARNAA